MRFVARSNKWEPWTKKTLGRVIAFKISNRCGVCIRIVGFDIPKEALVRALWLLEDISSDKPKAHQIMVPTTDTVRSAFLLQTMVASEYHVLYSGLTGTGKTVAPTGFWGSEADYRQG